MPARMHYKVRIHNQYTGGIAVYDADDMNECKHAINMHYGNIDMITYNGVVNMLQRGAEKSPKRFSTIRIVRCKDT